MPSHGSSQLELHPAWPRLTDDQRAAVNEVWDDMVVPALEDVAKAHRRRDDALVEAQDARGIAARVHSESGARSERERAARQALLAELAALRTRVLELEQGIELSEAA